MNCLPCEFCQNIIYENQERCFSCRLGTYYAVYCEKMVFKYDSKLAGICLRGGDITLKRNSSLKLSVVGVLENGKVFNIEPLSLNYEFSNNWLARIDKFGTMKSNFLFKEKGLLRFSPNYYPTMICVCTVNII